jgi:hypothetical protein
MARRFSPNSDISPSVSVSLVASLKFFLSIDLSTSLITLNLSSRDRDSPFLENPSVSLSLVASSKFFSSIDLSTSLITLNLSSMAFNLDYV